ncbi:hypothetical protein CTI12_AA385520 [Artemisia annua]|uniref:Uncharacterized protein n=1 Tax=Artemisia annua TaxID=35608 RepID=A0A2U1MFT3_ARTAN|nr:hypothetical protein CTI12_AA385520 [Artemisia annua]
MVNAYEPVEPLLTVRNEETVEPVFEQEVPGKVEQESFTRCEEGKDNPSSNCSELLDHGIQKQLSVVNCNAWRPAIQTQVLQLKELQKIFIFRYIVAYGFAH